MELQGKRSDLVTCAQKVKGYVGKLKYWKKQFEKKNLLAFENLRKLILHQNALLHALFILKVFTQSLREDLRIF